MRRGDKGLAVKKLQARLAELGFAIKADGIYGVETALTVALFQKSAGLDPDGIAGPLTLAKLAPGPVEYGVDYASVDGNKPPDFATVAKHASFAIIRGAWGTYVDPHLARDRAAASVAGLTVGAYLFLRHPAPSKPVPTVEDQVAAFSCAYGKRRPGELPPTLDVEFGDGRVSAAPALERIERAYSLLVTRYGVVMTYTSSNVWADDLDDLPSALGSGPLWLKVPYRWRAKNPTKLDSDHADGGRLPRPWRDTGAWFRQFQGDAVGFPGFSATVDVNRFLPRAGAPTVRDFARNFR